MAQTFARLGSRVTVFERRDRILPREDPQAAGVVQKQCERDGVQWVLNSGELEVQPADGGILIRADRHGRPSETFVERILIAVGRAPNVDGLNLEAAQVKYDPTGIAVDDFLRTSNPKIYAAGDVCSQYRFTHAADFMARTVIQNALFAVGPFGRKRVSDLIIPWATYTSPELAQVGLREHEALESGLDCDAYTQPFAEVDRAILEGRTEGFVKVLTQRGSDQIVGATIVGENAGDLICELTLAITQRIGLGRIASVVHPYPTQADAIRKLGDQFRRTRLTPRSQWILDRLRSWNVGS